MVRVRSSCCSQSRPKLMCPPETLFSIFYQQPRDVLQELAAHELISRDWRWHKVLRQWLQKDSTSTPSTGSTSLPLIDLTNGAPIGTQPIRKSDRIEYGVYVFFDAMNWRKERRYLDLDFEQLDPPRVSTGVGMPNGVAGAAPGLGGVQRVGSELGSAGGLGGSSQVPGA